MKNYLIRFDESKIFAVVEVAPGAEILGMQNQHIVTTLDTAVEIFETKGYDITMLTEAQKRYNTEV